jgi:putative transcriptional regulator
MQMIIKVQIDELLEKRGRSFYWLSKQTGISHTTLWRLKKDKALGINFVTLEKICQTLECEPGDILKLEDERNINKKRILQTKQIL